MFDLVNSIVGTNYRKILGRELYSGQPPVTVTDIQLRSSQLNLSLPKRTANMQSTNRIVNPHLNATPVNLTILYFYVQLNCFVQTFL